MMISGMILQSKGNNQMKEAVSDYNKSISKDTAYFNPEIYFSTTEDGIGLVMSF